MVTDNPAFAPLLGKMYVSDAFTGTPHDANISADMAMAAVVRLGFISG